MTQQQAPSLFGPSSRTRQKRQREEDALERAPEQRKPRREPSTQTASQHAAPDASMKRGRQANVKGASASGAGKSRGRRKRSFFVLKEDSDDEDVDESDAPESSAGSDPDFTGERVAKKDHVQKAAVSKHTDAAINKDASGPEAGAAAQAEVVTAGPRGVSARRKAAKSGAAQCAWQVRSSCQQT